MNPRELAQRLAAVTVIADAAKEAKDSLRAELLDALDAVGADSAKALLPDGTEVGKVSITSPVAAIAIADDRAFTAWVADNYPDEIIQTVRESFVKALMSRLTTIADGTIVDPDTGEVPPGLTIRNREPYVSMRFGRGGRDAVVDALRTGALPFEITQPTPALEA